MKKNRLGLFILLALVLVSTMVFSGCNGEGGTESTVTVTTTTTTTATAAPTDSEEVFHWKFTSTDSQGGIRDGLVHPYLADLIAEASDGRVQVEVYAVDEIVGPTEIHTAVQSGAIEMGSPIPGYMVGEVPSLNCLELPYLSSNALEAWQVYYQYGVIDILREECAEHGYYLLGIEVNTTPISLITKDQIHSSEDLDGLLAWVPPAVIPFLSQYGVVQTDVPGFDFYMGLKLGTIDFVGTAESWVYDLKLWEVAGYYLLPAFFAPIEPVIVNMDAWEALGPDLQQRIQDRVDAHFWETIPLQLEKDAEYRAECEANGIVYYTLSDEEQAKWAQAAQATWETLLADANPAILEVLEEIKD